MLWASAKEQMSGCEMQHPVVYPKNVLERDTFQGHRPPRTCQAWVKNPPTPAPQNPMPLQASCKRKALLAF